MVCSLSLSLSLSVFVCVCARVCTCMNHDRHNGDVFVGVYILAVESIILRSNLCVCLIVVLM
jgi:hypothetical protein